MSQYGDSEWKGRARKRSQMRSEVRSRFIAENGTTPATSFDEIGLSPKMMRRRIITLLKITRDGDVGAENLELLTALAKLMATTGFGAAGEMADVTRTVISPQKSDLMSLLDHFTVDTQNRFRL